MTIPENNDDLEEQQQQQEQPANDSELITATPVVPTRKRQTPPGPIVHAVQAELSSNRKGRVWHVILVVIIIAIAAGVGFGVGGKKKKRSTSRTSGNEALGFEPAVFSFEATISEVNVLPGNASGGRWGAAVVLSADGNTLAVGAPGTNSNGPSSGLVQILTYINGTQQDEGWVPLGLPIKGDTEEDALGSSVAISANGRIVVCGIPSNDVGGLDAGLVRVFRFNDAAANNGTIGSPEAEWIQVGQDLFGKQIEATNFGSSVAISEDGLTLVAASSQEGYVEMYRYDSKSDSWNPLGALEGKEGGDRFGEGLSISGDGSTVAIGAPMHNGGIGYVQLSRWDGDKGEWVQLGDSSPYLQGDGKDDNFGSSVALSRDGSCVAVGANQFGLATTLPGFVRVLCLDKSRTMWNQIGDDILGDKDKDIFGESVGLSSDASLIVVGAPGSDRNGSSSGRVQLFGYDGTAWQAHGDDGVRFNGMAGGDQLGASVAISADGSTIVGGAFAADGLTGQAHVYRLH